MTMCPRTILTRSSGAHSRNHLSSIIADHYKEEDVDFQLWGEL